MTSNPDLSQPDTTTARAPMGHPPRGTPPGVVTYLVLAIWSGVVMTAIAAGIFAGGASLRLLPAAQAIPIAAVAIGYRAWPRFRSYLLTLDLRLVLAAQLWRVIGIAFLFALAFDQLPAALAVVLALGNGSLTRGRLYAFTALGVVDFLIANASGLSLEPSTLGVWPLVIFPTLMIPFFAILHLVAVLQSRHDWDDRVRHYAIQSQDQAPTP